jgi:hypothetical protein
MRRTAFLVFISIAIACKEEKQNLDYSGYRDSSFVLVTMNEKREWKDSIAIVKLKIPQQLDTFYQWHRQSDCLTCGRRQYRFANTRYVQFAESGFYWDHVPDSVFQFTFIHDPVILKKNKILGKLNPSDTSYLPAYLANHCTRCDEFSFLFKKYEIIHKRPFILTAFVSKCSLLTQNKPSLFVGAATYLKNMTLFMVAEKTGSDTTGFANLIHKSIASLNIEER